MVASPNLTVPLGTTLKLRGSAVSSVGLNVTAAWAVLSAPPRASYAQVVGGSRAEFTLNTPGTYLFQLAAADGCLMNRSLPVAVVGKRRPSAWRCLPARLTSRTVTCPANRDPLVAHIAQVTSQSNRASPLGTRHRSALTSTVRSLRVRPVGGGARHLVAAVVRRVLVVVARPATVPAVDVERLRAPEHARLQHVPDAAARRRRIPRPTASVARIGTVVPVRWHLGHLRVRRQHQRIRPRRRSASPPRRSSCS